MTPEEKRAYARAYRQRPEVRAKERERSRRRSAERSQQRNHARRVAMTGAYCERVERLVVLEMDDGICGICGEDVDPMRFHVDHIVPISRGGAHAYFNVQVAHPSCNVRKHTDHDAPLLPFTPAGRRSERARRNDETIVALFADGLTYDEVAAEIGVCDTTVKNRVAAMRASGRKIQTRRQGQRKDPGDNGWARGTR